MKTFRSIGALGLALCVLQSGVLATAAPATRQVISHSRVTGRVVLSPVCPVVHLPPDPACAPKPYKTLLQIKNQVNSRVYRTLATSALGTFSLLMAPGRYILQVRQGTNVSRYPRCTAVKFIVAPGKALKLLMNCDTGIR